MKIIVDKTSNIVILFYDDAVDVILEEESITTSIEKVHGLGTSNCILVENVTLPSDWEPLKYCYSDSSWSLNSNYVKEGSNFDPSAHMPIV